jgi:glycosyltransferase involved in cell wall biosynthesis
VAAAIEAQADSKQVSAALSNESGCLNILVLGRLDSNQKGLDLLLDFLEGAATLRGILHVNIVGEGYYGATLEKRIRASNLLTTLVSSNPWSNSPVEVMSRHDVLFIPSRYEGVPLVMLEAMCLGLPVVSSDLPGTRAFLPKACLFPVGDLGRAFEIMLELTRPDFRREVIGRNLEMFNASSSQTAFKANVSRLTDQLLGICARHSSIVTHLTDSPVAPNGLQIRDGRVNARDAMH